jgi:hypothetical protein
MNDILFPCGCEAVYSEKTGRWILANVCEEHYAQARTIDDEDG